MSLIERIISSLPSTDTKVERVVRGHRWDMVISTRSGVAGIPASPEGHPATADPPFIGKPLYTLFPMAEDPSPAKAALGLAAVNAALASTLGSDHFQRAAIPRAGGKTVGLVGDFAFAHQLEELADEVILIEKDDAEFILPRVDIAILPGWAMVDHSLERLLAASQECYTIVFGPSTPLSPVLFDFGADQLVGVSVKNPEEVATWITSGTQNLMECPGLRSVVLRK